MTASEETRHTAREKLVESAELHEEERLWSPGNPMNWAARGYMSSGPDYHQDMMTGRTREWKKHYVILNLLLALTAVAFMGLLLAWGFYGPAIGLESAMILFFVGVTALGSVAFIIGRAIVNQEYGLRGFRGRKR